MEENTNPQIPSINSTQVPPVNIPVAPPAPPILPTSTSLEPKANSSLKFIITTILLVFIASVFSFMLGRDSGSKANLSSRTKTDIRSSQPAQIPSPTPLKSLDTPIEKTPTSTPASADADWNTYQGDGFTFNYPSTFQNKEGVLRSPDYEVDTEGIETLSSGIELSVLPRPTKETSIEKIYTADRFAGQIETSKTNTIVAGKNAIRYDYSYENTQATVTIFINKSTYYWVKLRWADKLTKDKYLSIYNQILSTFKFTE